MRDTEFAKFIQCIEPLKEEKESMPSFVNRVFVEYTPYRDEVPNIDIKRKPATLRTYAYGTSEISKPLARDLLKAGDEESFAEYLEDTTEEITQLVLENFIHLFNMTNLTRSNMHIEISKLLTTILRKAATSTKKKSPQPTNVEDFINSIKVEDGKIILGNSKWDLPTAEIPAEEIPDYELKLKYIHALIDAYNEAGKTNIDVKDKSKFKKKYKENFQEQRVNFYEAESLKNFSRDTIASDTDEFQKLLDETYDGVINTSRKNYNNGYDRLLSVLEQATQLQFNVSRIYDIPGMITIKRKCGFCHMLVNENRLVWVEEDEDE
ncbi:MULTISPECIES: ABC-three component system protein [Helcococcus]|uniref:ABC-three component system protein n=1 Tax=Helcococcus bovis TaxID=3153252 RepID=A0ABW9F5A1_9FIRM